ncbi:MAG: HAMP domain-containing protein, partial [Eubacterium sp.]
MAILVLGGISIFKSAQMVKSDSEDRLTWMARQYAAQFSNELNLIENNVQEMEVHVRDTFDLEQLKTNPNYLAAYEKELSDYIFNFASKRSLGIAAWCYFNPALSQTPHDVYYVDGNGDDIPDRQEYIPFSYYDHTPTPTDDKQWWYGPIETKAGFWTNPYEWTLKNDEVIKVVSYARPIFMEDQLVAVVGTYYHFDEMFQNITDIQVYENGYATLYNEKLDVIIDPDYTSGTRYTSDNLGTVENGKYAEISAQILKNNYGTLTYEEGNTEQLFAYSKLSNGWVLGIKPVKSEIYAGIYTLTVALLIAVLVCMILSVFAAYIMGYHITKPLRKVVASARKIGTGDLSVQVEVQTKDEIKTVADSLNEMVKHTKALQSELEYLAYYDDLTGMANKNLFKITAERLISHAEKQYAYVVLDINRFKVINDIFGYSCGDA